ncbi:hypothetical protein BESB_021740 [Besnoitia besnoiti]|uniref:Transmembrane protein n=1 Tax=Besnoitia besnoiti TaxID=94643 RepID=A0A2A9M974_BESBE|nr:hypothetical protein BESB_021740 [Besnoitia besnoiti]PFH32233.1 hypothetical protein BESB_021740 [Besnoitia besnoiti]
MRRALASCVVMAGNSRPAVRSDLQEVAGTVESSHPQAPTSFFSAAYSRVFGRLAPLRSEAADAGELSPARGAVCDCPKMEAGAAPSLPHSSTSWRNVKVVCGFLALLGATALLGIAAAAMHSVMGDYYFTQGTVGGLMHHKLTPVVLALRASLLVRFLSTLFFVFVVAATVLTALSELAALGLFPGSPAIDYLRRHFAGSALEPMSSYSLIDAPQPADLGIRSTSGQTPGGASSEDDDSNRAVLTATRRERRAAAQGPLRSASPPESFQEQTGLQEESAVSTSVWWKPLHQSLKRLLSSLLFLLGYRVQRCCPADAAASRRSQSGDRRQRYGGATSSGCAAAAGELTEEEAGSAVEADAVSTTCNDDSKQARRTLKAERSRAGVRRRVGKKSDIEKDSLDSARLTNAGRQKKPAFDGDWLVVDRDDRGTMQA